MSKLVAVGTVAFDAIETPFGKTDKILGGAATYIPPPNIISSLDPQNTNHKSRNSNTIHGLLLEEIIRTRRRWRAGNMAVSGS